LELDDLNLGLGLAGIVEGLLGADCRLGLEDVVEEDLATPEWLLADVEGAQGSTEVEDIEDDEAVRSFEAKVELAGICEAVEGEQELAGSASPILSHLHERQGL